MSELAVIAIPEVPATAFLHHDEHVSDVVRELQLIQVGRDDGSTAGELPPRLCELIPELLSAFSHARDSSRRQAEEARMRGDDTFTLEVTLPRASADTVATLGDLLEEVDDYARSGDLLTLPASDEVVALRRWLVAQVTARHPQPEVRQPQG